MNQPVHDLEALIAASQVLSDLTPDGASRALDQLAAHALDRLGADQSFILVRNIEHGYWTVEAAAGKVREDFDTSVILDLECPIAVQALQSKQPSSAHFVDASLQHAERKAHFLSGSVLALPLIEQSEPIGVLLLVREGRSAAHWNLLLGQGLAGITGIAMTILHKEDRLKHLEGMAEALAHDLKAPGERMRDLAVLLRQEYSSRLDERGNRWLRLLEHNGGDLAARVNGLLEIAGVAVQRQGRDAVDPKEVLKEVMEAWADEIVSRQARMDVESDFGLVSCHASSLRQIFENLISNALKFSGERPDLNIRISSESCNGQLHILVADNGLGIPANQRERVFEPFVRLRPDAAGSGIGLSIVKRLVQAYGGRIWIEATPEGGCSVSFTLPLITTLHKSEVGPKATES